MADKPKILVAIPAYNCEKQIGRVLKGFDKQTLDRIERVIVIDDRGGDNTASVAQAAIDKLKIGNKVKVVQNVKNLGLGGSHKMAILHGENMGADYVAILHGDDQAKAKELNNLFDVAVKDPSVGAVLGSRFMKGADLEGYAKERIWGNRVLNAAYTVLSFKLTRDLGSGLNLFRLQDLADRRYLGFDDRMTFNFDLLLDYYSKGTKLVNIPITWHESDQVTNARNVQVAKRAARQLLLWRVGALKFEPRDAALYQSKPYKPEPKKATRKRK
ncbi:MAG TPA: glycosyltransferase family 2 protein [Candidatus Saccharimonadales bacterium]|nr:glycosyltransferase family 2 protein [Candidatus Saccharimonadales bacterium]